MLILELFFSNCKKALRTAMFFCSLGTREANTLDIKHLRILIVDDDPFNINILKLILGRWSIYPDSAANGLHAVNMVKQNRYDVILMDIDMPVMDGIEASREIKMIQEQMNIKIQIIAVTANFRVTDERDLPIRSIDAFIFKPLHPQELLHTLESIARTQHDQTITKLRN